MKRSLKRVYWTASLLTMVLAVAAIGMMVGMKLEDSRSMTRAILHASSSWTVDSTDGLQELAENIAAASPPLRVTFLLGNGMVLADSAADPLSMPNHLNRPEVQQALENDTGESLRISDTQATLAFYAAKRISPMLILRLCYPLSDILRLLLFYCVSVAFLCIVLYLLQRLSFKRFASRMVSQLDGVRRLLEGDEDSRTAVFPEFQPALDHIAYLAERLNHDLEEVVRTARLRSDFVANASHELRSPLTSIMGFAEMVAEGMADTPEEQALCLSMIRNECQRMLAVIEDILNQSRAEHRHDQPAQEVDVAAVAGEICQALAPQAAQKKITLRITGTLAMPGWEKDIWEILYNLTGNAIRYGRQGGYVDIQLESGLIVVEDDGIGIPQEHLPYLFEPFYRVDENRNMGTGGTGLGLSIVRTLVQRCGGQVGVESEPGKGSRFIVTFDRSEEVDA